MIYPLKRFLHRKKKRSEPDYLDEEYEVLTHEVLDDPKACPDGEIFCLNTGSCSKVCKNKQEPESGDKLNLETSCPPGQKFCQDSESCSADCHDEGSVGIPDDDLFTSPDMEARSGEGSGEANVRQKRSALEDDIACSDGEVFCVQSGKCSSECGDQHEQSEGKCPDGKIYCSDTDTCAESCNKNDQGLGRITKRESGDFCPEGQIFCVDAQACAVSCANADQSWGRSGKPDLGIECPAGQVFCLTSGICSQDCNNDDDDKDPDDVEELNVLSDDQACPQGTVYCLDSGICSEGNYINNILQCP